MLNDGMVSSHNVVASLGEDLEPSTYLTTFKTKQEERKRMSSSNIMMRVFLLKISYIFFFGSMCHGFLPTTRFSTPPIADVTTHLCQPAKQKELRAPAADGTSESFVSNLCRDLSARTAAATVALSLLLASSPAAMAADFANRDISGMDFSGQDLRQKDFTGVIARKTNFHNANLEGTKFQKAVLEQADFSGSNVRAANFLDATLDGASFKDALAERAVFSATILDIGDLENIDLTDSMWPSEYGTIVVFHAFSRRCCFVICETISNHYGNCTDTRRLQ